MNRSGSGAQCSNKHILTQIAFQIRFHSGNIWSQRGNPIGIKGLLNIYLLLPAHVRRGKPNFFFIHYQLVKCSFGETNAQMY